MVCSRLPVPSFFCLFGALLMLSPKLLLGIHDGLSEVPITDRVVQNALTFAMEKYNKYRADSTNYFKVLHVLKAKEKVIDPGQYYFRLDLVKTTCKKKAGGERTYESIQSCEQLPGNQEILHCYFVVMQDIDFLIENCT